MFGHTYINIDLKEDHPQKITGEDLFWRREPMRGGKPKSAKDKHRAKLAKASRKRNR